MSLLKMRRLLSELGVAGPNLLLRSYGQRAFPILEKELLEVPLGQTLILDFEGISVMDTSFADETVVQLAIGLTEERYGDRFLILQQPSPATVENIEGTILRRKEKVTLLVREKNGWELLGHLESNLAEAWNLALREDELTARYLADRLRLQINTASMRLHKLHKARLLARREEVTPAGRQHIYSLPQ